MVSVPTKPLLIAVTCVLLLVITVVLGLEQLWVFNQFWILKYWNTNIKRLLRTTCWIKLFFWFRNRSCFQHWDMMPQASSDPENTQSVQDVTTDQGTDHRDTYDTALWCSAYANNANNMQNGFKLEQKRCTLWNVNVFVYKLCLSSKLMYFTFYLIHRFSHKRSLLSWQKKLNVPVNMFL